MADQKIYKLIQGLYAKTRNREVKWQKSIDREFLASFNNYSVGISEVVNRRTGMADIHLKIYDSLGDEIENASDTDFDNDPDSPEAYTMLEYVYENARRVALGVDTALDTLLMELGA